MRCLPSGWFHRLVLMTLLPVTAVAQPTIARSFEQLQGLLDRASIVVVIDTAGRETWGRVVEVSASALTLAVMERDGDRTLTTSRTRTLLEHTIALIVRSDGSGRMGPAIYPASWHKVEAVRPETPITIELETGERRSYCLTSADRDRLQVLTSSGRTETVEKSRVVRMLRRGFDDPVGNGVALGALTGGGAALALVAIERRRCGPTCNEPPNVAALTVTVTALYAGAGALVGWIVDRSHKGTDVLFPVAPAPRSSISVSPVLWSGSRGVRLTIRF
jgi:hypothetical protein